jgi:CheY-like chemotaxis protein
MNTEIEHGLDVRTVNKPKLLLADDSVTIRKVVELTFADEGIDVTTVSDGETAMQRFVEMEPDIVLLDVNMPDPTGYHICEMIKQDEATRHIPVLLLVGSFEPFDQDEAERVGADGFVVKPFQSIRELVTKVKDLLGPEKEPVRPAPETTDIDNLYEKSFADTDEMDPAVGKDVFLGDAGLDDEIIELSHPADERTGSFTPDNDPDMINESIEPFPPQAAEVDEMFEGLDWSARPADELPADEVPDDQAPIDTPPAEVERPDEPGDIKSRYDDEHILDLDEVDTLRDMDVDQEIHVTTPDIVVPSDEFITLVARRVIEKLSDRVIREIAKDAVPRIAENLIREALEEDKKN